MKTDIVVITFPPPWGNKSKLDVAKEFVDNHLIELVKELLEWETTGELPSPSKLRELGELCSFATNRLNLAERLVTTAAFRMIAANNK